MNTSLPLSRRAFVKKSALVGAAAAVPLILPSGLRAQNAASKKLTVGVIGCGNISDSHFPALLGYPESVKIIAVCDVDRERRDDAADRVNRSYGTNDCKAYADFRELNRRTDLDAVFVCTPDHWHALVAI